MIYVNGDSYSAVSDGKRFSEFLGEHYNCVSVNNSIPGSCNSRIFRTSLRDLIDLKKEYANIKAVLLLSFPMRTEVWDAKIINNKFVNDGEFTSFQLLNSKKWFHDKIDVDESRYKEFYKQFIDFYNVEAETVKLLQNIILFTSWCKQNNVEYVVISGPLQESIDFSAPFVKSFYNEVCCDTNVIDIFKDSFTEWCVSNGHTPIDNYTQEIHGETYNVGHHGEAAHKAFANFLITNYFK